MPRKKSGKSDPGSPPAPASDASSSTSPLPAAAPAVAAPAASLVAPSPVADEALDDVVMLLLQLEPGDTAELEQVRQALAGLARATEDFDAAVALGRAATELAAVIAGTDEAQRAAALARANALVEGAVARLEGMRVAAPAAAPAAAGDELPDDVDPELLRDFVAESRDCLASSEAALLALENDPEDVDAVNTV
ncbi:MAG TPA: hypothetical protein VF048_14520, partial [Gemmatimonadaceae bacterium]